MIIRNLFRISRKANLFLNFTIYKIFRNEIIDHQWSKTMVKIKLFGNLIFFKDSTFAFGKP